MLSPGCCRIWAFAQGVNLEEHIVTRTSFLIGWVAFVVAGALGGSSAGAQMLGAPVLQNAFSNSGITVAVNYGGGSDYATFAVAGAWAPGSARWQFSAGAGVISPKDGDGALNIGGRLAVPIKTFGRTKAFGVSVFAGAGGAKIGETSFLQAPVGLGLGYRRAIGATRGISLYATPFYSLSRSDSSGIERSGLVRGSIGVDLSLTRSIGATVGFETGAKARAGEAGATGSLWGVGVSYAFR